MKRVVFLFTFLIITIGIRQHLNAQTPGGLKPSQLTYDDFQIMAEAESDTLLALVNMFFRKRKENKTGFIILGVSYPAAALIGAGTAIGAGLSGSTEDPEKAIQGFFLVYSYLFLGAATYLTINTLSYTKPRLYSILTDYQNGKPIPDKLKRRIRQVDYSKTKPR